MQVGYVCDTCETYNALSSAACSSCGNSLGSSNMSMTACPSCGNQVPTGNLFCGRCGARIGGAPQPAAAGGGGGGGGNQFAAAKTMFFGAMQAPGQAKLILIKGQGMDGLTYYLQSTEHVAGRSEGQIQFNEKDPLLSPRHCNFVHQDNTLTVLDMGSANGVFLRARNPVPLASGDTFLVGEQLLRVEKSYLDEAPAHDDDGTYFYASPRIPCAFRLIQLLHGGAEGACFCAARETIRIGREGNDLNFPDDHFISGQHAEIAVTPDGFKLVDLGSKNGTFYRIHDQAQLSHGDYVFIGQQLLRVEIT